MLISHCMREVALRRPSRTQQVGQAGGRQRYQCLLPPGGEIKGNDAYSHLVGTLGGPTEQWSCESCDKSVHSINRDELSGFVQYVCSTNVKSKKN